MKIQRLKSKNILSVIIIILLVVVLFSFVSFKKEDLAAEFSGGSISMKELDAEYGALPEFTKLVTSKADFIDVLVTKEILLIEADELGISVDDEDVSGYVSDTLASAGISEEEYKELLASRNTTESDQNNMLKEQLKINQLLNITIDTQVSEDEIAQYYADHSFDFRAKEGEIRVSHILVETEDEINSIAKQLKEGASFSDIAEQKSLCPSGQDGGDLGFFAKGSMVKEFEDVAFSLKYGQISSPVKTQFGWHIIRGEKPFYTFDEVGDKIKALLLESKQRLEFEEYVVSLKEKYNLKVYYSEQTEQSVAPSQKTELQRCIDGFGLKDDTIIIFNANFAGCKICAQAMPLLEKLESIGREVLYVDAVSKQNKEVLDACFKDSLPSGFPQFICAGTGEIKLGLMTDEQLIAFAESC